MFFLLLLSWFMIIFWISQRSNRNNQMQNFKSHNSNIIINLLLKKKLKMSKICIITAIKTTAEIYLLLTYYLQPANLSALYFNLLEIHNIWRDLWIKANPDAFYNCKIFAWVNKLIKTILILYKCQNVKFYIIDLIKDFQRLYLFLSFSQLFLSFLSDIFDYDLILKNHTDIILVSNI